MAKKKKSETEEIEVGGVPATVPAAMLERMSEAKSSVEELAADGFAIPFLGLAQKMSYEIDPDHEKYIEGLKVGDIFDNVTGQIYRNGVEVIPCNIRASIIEWVPREQGGGFVAEYSSMREYKNYGNPENEAESTITYTVLYRDLDGDYEAPEEGWMPALLTMSKTKEKVAKRWNSQLRLIKIPGPDGKPRTAPEYGTKWALTPVKATNSKGSYYNFSLRFLGLVESVKLYDAAAELSETAENMPTDVVSDEDDDGVERPDF